MTQTSSWDRLDTRGSVKQRAGRNVDGHTKAGRKRLLQLFGDRSRAGKPSVGRTAHDRYRQLDVTVCHINLRHGCVGTARHSQAEKIVGRSSSGAVGQEVGDLRLDLPFLDGVGRLVVVVPISCTSV